MQLFARDGLFIKLRGILSVNNKYLPDNPIFYIQSILSGKFLGTNCLKLFDNTCLGEIPLRGAVDGDESQARSHSPHHQVKLPQQAWQLFPFRSVNKQIKLYTKQQYAR